MTDSEFDLILAHALSLNGEERDTFVRSHEPETVSRLLPLLAAADSLDGEQFLETPLLQEPPESDFATINAGVATLDCEAKDALTDNMVGKFIGPYKILERIGRGGMGMVYKAEQIEPICRIVAIKVIRADQPSVDVVGRFEAERQALARMAHQNIAKVFDAGTTALGQPYFVMELVNGTPISEYCDSHQLPLNERLEIFEQTCRAVEHAHQNSFIHRDLKPSNILVVEEDDTPVVKVIDFGLAKAVGDQVRMTDRTKLTQSGTIMGTLGYMSPEQTTSNNLDIDTRTDVYSLGVILFELLTGSLPIPIELLRADTDEILRRIRETEPPLASIRLGEFSHVIAGIAKNRQTNAKRLVRQLRGDLDSIVLKAMRKNRVDRYDTAASLANDVKRHLRCEAIDARPPSISYLAYKLVLRNLVLVVSSGVISFVLIAGSSVALWFGFSAMRAAISERQQKDAANRISNQLVDALQETESNLARSNFFLAAARINENRADLASKTLEAIPPQFRKLEWDFARQKITGGYQTLYGHQNGASCVAFSPDGSMIASAGDGPEIRIWNAIEGAEIRVIKAHDRRIESLAFSPDGSQLASASWDMTAKLWNIQTGDLKQTYSEHHAPVTSIAFSPDGKLLAAGCLQEFDPHYVATQKGMFKIWEIEPNKTIHTLSGHTNHVHCIAFSPDGETLASSGMEIILWNVASGEKQRTLMGHDFHVPSVAFSPDGKQLVSAGDRDATAIIWDIASGFLLHTLRGHSEFLTEAAFSPDGKTVVTSSADRTICLWDSVSGKMKRTFKGHRDWVNGVTFSPLGNILVSASRDSTLKMWDLRVVDEFKTIARSAKIKGISWCDLKETFATAGPGSDIEIWDRDLLKPMRTIATEHQREVTCVAISPDGTKVATGGWDKFIRIWDVSSGKKLLQLQSNTGSSISDVQFSPNGHLIAAAGRVVDVWDATSGSPVVSFDGHLKHVFGISFSPDSRWLASGSADDTAKIWNPLSGEVKLTIDDLPFWCYDLTFSPSGNLVATVSLDEVSIWGTVDGSRRMVLKHKGVRRVSFSNESRLVTANDSAGDSTLKIWDTISGDELMTLNGHKGRIDGLACSSDGKMILSCGDDATIKVWKPVEQR